MNLDIHDTTTTMSSPRYLTKSRFKLAVECPAKLYYTGKPQEYFDSSTEDEFLAMLAEGGYQVGELAKLRYPGGIEIRERNHDAAVAETESYLRQENVVLFEPAIRVGPFFIRIDILVKRGNKFELIEVKAKSYDSKNPQIEGARGGIKADMLPYLQDAAFQAWVLQQALPYAEISTFLMMPDKACVAPVDKVNQIFLFAEHSDGSTIEVRNRSGVDLKNLAETLLAKVPIDRYVHSILDAPLKFPGGPDHLADAACRWAEAYQQDRRVTPVIGSHCGSCQFNSNDPRWKSGFHECWKLANDWTDADFAGGTVLDLWNFRKKQELIEQGVLKISQVQRDDIGRFEDDPGESGMSRMLRQWQQVNGVHPSYDQGGFYFDDGLVQAEMSQWRFPYHLIDFETSATALPFHEGMRPYEPVAFQFSHHVIEQDGRVRHVGQFLEVTPGTFPNYAFTRALMQELGGDDGTVFMWSHHENTILSKITDQLRNDPHPPSDAAELIAFLSSLTKGGAREMVDLCRLAEKAYYHPDTEGSNSIKKVLPSVLKVSEFLRRAYSQPIYGAPDGIPSLNFSSTEGMVWLRIDEGGNVADPYLLLKQQAEALLPDSLPADSVHRTSLIANGAAAATAYARLQFEEMLPEARLRIEDALLRYCELDTLAMVMVVQAWQELI